MEEKRFDEKVMDAIQGPPKVRIPITFPETVLQEFSLYAQENAADCYWLAIKRLLDFFKEQTQGDLRAAIIMKHIEDVKDKIDDLNIRVIQLEKPKQKEFKTFGQTGG